MCGEASVFCDMLGNLQGEGLLKGESFFCCFIFVLCCWFVYIDEGIVIVWKIESIAHLFWYWVFYVFDVVLREDFFYVGAEP